MTPMRQLVTGSFAWHHVRGFGGIYGTQQKFEKNVQFDTF